MLIIFLCSLPWYKKCKDIPITGLPLFFVMLACVWYTNLLPSSVYMYGVLSVFHIVVLFVVVDFIQFCMHFAFHKKIFGLYIYSSHNIHHKVKDPTPKDAFSTGIYDSIIQLIIPIYISIYLVNPNRTTVTVFGILYSQWLLYIHSELFQVSKYLVSPKYHKRHHENLEVNLAHVFPLWDNLSNTKDL